MDQQEQDSMIATALRERTEAKRNLRMITDGLREVGRQLIQIGHSLNPAEGRSADKALEANLRMLSTPILEIISAAKLQAMIAERNELESVIENRTATLQEYGAE